MENIFFEKTDNAPGIILDSNKKLIEIYGESRPEDAKLFFEPIFNWISDFYKKLQGHTAVAAQQTSVTVNFKLEYFNSSSAKYFAELIKEISKIENDISHTKIIFNWYYDFDDEDLMQTGKILMNMTNIKMNFIGNE